MKLEGRMKTEDKALCVCGAKECWDRSDASWLSSNSGWRGEINGCQTSVFFIHGKKIKEQREIPEGWHQIADLPNLLKRWSVGLKNAYLVWEKDTGSGSAGLWIEGIREPNDIDLARLSETRERMRQKAKSDLAWIFKQFPDLSKEDDE